VKREKISEVACWIGFVLVAAGVGAYGYTSNAAHRLHAIGPDGCFANQPPPATLVIAADQTDRLEGDQPRRWRTGILSQIGTMPAGTRILLAHITDHVDAEMKFEMVACVPPAGNSARARLVRDKIDSVLAALQRNLESAPELKQSPIRRTILAIATDPEVRQTTRIELMVPSDLLEHDGQVSAYGSHLTLPVAPGTPLRGVSIRFLVLKNERDARLQTPELVNDWLTWAKAEGAQAIIADAPFLGDWAPGSGAGL
jgi:hypothetical protein